MNIRQLFLSYIYFWRHTCCMPESRYFHSLSGMIDSVDNPVALDDDFTNSESRNSWNCFSYFGELTQGIRLGQ